MFGLFIALHFFFFLLMTIWKRVLDCSVKLLILSGVWGAAPKSDSSFADDKASGDLIS